MIEDMRVRNLAPRTQATYILQVSLFARHFHRSPGALGPEEIRAYQVFLVKQKKLVPNSVSLASRALRDPRLLAPSSPAARRRHRLAGPSLCRHIRLGKLQEQPQDLIDRRRIGEHFGHIGLEKHDVRAGAVSLIMLPANALGEVVFWSNLVLIVVLNLSIHTVSVLRESPHGG